MLHDILYFVFVFVVHNYGHFAYKKKSPCASSNYPKPCDSHNLPLFIIITHFGSLGKPLQPKQ